MDNISDTYSTSPDRSSTVRKSILYLGRWINYDFCPGWNRYVYWLKKPFGWVICAILFSALVGFLIGPQGFVLMWSLTAFLVVGAIWPWLGMKGISCRLDFDVSNSEEQRPTTLRLSVVNRWPIPVFGLSIEGSFLQDIFQDEDNVALALQRIPGWSESEFTSEFKPDRRGVLPQSVPFIVTGFPFGIYHSQKEIELQRQVIVWPKCKNLKAEVCQMGVNFNIEGQLSDRPGHDGDVIGTRPYRLGDSLRHVNWPKTAGLGKLIVLERQTAAQKSVRVITNLNPEDHFGSGSRSTYEHAIRVAATIARHFHSHHSHVQVDCVGVPLALETQANNSRGLNPLMDFLATLPVLEDLKSNADKNSNVIDAAQLKIRPNEEVFWIDTNDTSETALPSVDSQVHRILIESELDLDESGIALDPPKVTSENLAFSDPLENQQERPQENQSAMSLAGESAA